MNKLLTIAALATAMGSVQAEQVTTGPMMGSAISWTFASSSEVIAQIDARSQLVDADWRFASGPEVIEQVLQRIDAESATDWSFASSEEVIDQVEARF